MEVYAYQPNPAEYRWVMDYEAAKNRLVSYQMQHKLF